ncbi:hypothetical protein [Saccharothrix syringae]|uniref:hypothetical protein n=1 Tax=Saccharothrix syringae TaxID=103733 RepID=UPI00052453B0|nr:hypothetical protein [Saccharothrix syringae]
MTELERRYRRLLALYPRDHRERHGEEMLDVLLAGSAGRARPGPRAAADVLWGAVRLHLRRVAAVDGGLVPGDVPAVVALLGPLALLTGVTTGLHEIAWWIKAGALWDMPWATQFPDAPLWVVWAAVAVLVLFTRLRRVAAAGAWAATAGSLLLETAWDRFWGTGYNTGWVLLGALTAAALTWSPGPARGRELLPGRAVPVMIATVVAAVALGVLVGGGLQFPVLVAGTVAACCHGTRTGRRAALVLALPAVSTLSAFALMVWVLPPPTTPVDGTLIRCLPVLLALLALGFPALVRRRRADQPLT